MTNSKNFDIKLGMTYTDFFNKNMNELQKLSSEQKQKIANFWQDDEDHKVTNEVELAVLEGFTSRDGKVKMPEGNPSLFMNREYCKYEGLEEDYTDTFRSEAPEYKNSRLVIQHYGRGQNVRVVWEHDADSKYVINDTLCDSGDKLNKGGKEHTDDLADGYADSRFIGYTDNETGGTGVSRSDNDLNGTFEVGYDEKKGLSLFITRMFLRPQSINSKSE